MKKALIVFLATLLAMAVGCVKVSKPEPAAKGTIDPHSGKSCYQCHRSKVKGPVVHGALESMECTPCHQVQPGNHQTNHALFAVKDKSAKLCWECHDSPTNAKSVHPVIEDQGCTACHSPHSAPYQHLLYHRVPGLCFRCHEKKMIEEKRSNATDFRDGDENLHYLHAGQNKIPCLTCHDVHASPQLHLIRPKGNFGKEAVTINYTGNDKGGSCTPSCHDQMVYTRK